MLLKAYIDGACRGNPGPASIGILVTDENDNPIYKSGRFIGPSTNNQAEYQVLIALLEIIVSRKNKSFNIDRLIIHSDSELLIRQMLGTYKIKNPHLIKLHLKVRKFLNYLDFPVEFIKIKREENRQADRLANKALDEAMNIENKVQR